MAQSRHCIFLSNKKFILISSTQKFIVMKKIAQTQIYLPEIPTVTIGKVPKFDCKSVV